MSTDAKGDALEDKTYSILKEHLENGLLGIEPSSGKIYKKKAYPSKDQEEDIIVDISIEVWPSNADHYALLWVCECKNHGQKVSMDDIEAFKAKLDRIAGKHIKGLITSTHSFQSGAIAFSRNQGIGLVRILPSDQVSWFMHDITRNSASDKKLSGSEFNKALTNENYQSIERSFFSACDGYIFGDWQSLLRHSLKITSQAV